jgi:hypothetical protein
MSRVQVLLREPLVHFLLIGTALFLTLGLTQEQGGDASNRILVDAGRVEQWVARSRRTWLRPPTKKELAGLVESHVRDEVYYREALAMGLGRNDRMVRQRMRQKLEFILEDLSIEQAPSDEVLATYLGANADRFRTEPRLTFSQVYLNPDQPRDLAAKATRVCATTCERGQHRSRLVTRQCCLATSRRRRRTRSRVGSDRISPTRYSSRQRAPGRDRCSPGLVRTWSRSTSGRPVAPKRWTRRVRSVGCVPDHSACSDGLSDVPSPLDEPSTPGAKRTRPDGRSWAGRRAGVTDVFLNSQARRILASYPERGMVLARDGAWEALGIADGEYGRIVRWDAVG